MAEQPGGSGGTTPPTSGTTRLCPHTCGMGSTPYLETPGFLTGFSQTFRDSLVEVEIPVLVRTIRGKGELQTVKSLCLSPQPDRDEQGR